MPRILALEVVDHGADGGAGGADLLGAAGEAAQRRRNANLDGHDGSSWTAAQVTRAPAATRVCGASCVVERVELLQAWR